MYEAGMLATITISLPSLRPVLTGLIAGSKVPVAGDGMIKK